MSPSANRVYLEAAFVLHQRPYRDTSVLLDVFSANHGRIGLVARGVRGRKSAWQPLSQAFVPLLMSWSGRGELGTVTGLESNGTASQLRGQVLLSGIYINELLTRLLHRHDPHPELFHHYSELLCQLAASTNEPESGRALQAALRLFEKKLLQEIGYGLILDHDVASGEPLQSDQLYRYQLNQGPVLAQELDHLQPGLLVSGASLLALDNEHLDNAVSLRDAKRLMRQLLDQQLGERPLNSRRLLADLQRVLEAQTLISMDQ